jgi:MFS transporter, OFA family, oxalate/formate antiporter
VASKGNPPIDYGWYIVLVAFLANFTSVGTTFYIFNAFMEPLCRAHGWTRTDINAAIVLGF